MDKSICGGIDDRTPSNDPKIGRLVSAINNEIGCTATLIGNGCAITAAHCKGSAKYIEFDVPNSNSDGTPNHPESEKIYEVTILDSENYGIGNDWMVIKILPNETGELPSRERGFYNVSFNRPMYNTHAKITGFGVDVEGDRNGTQQTASGEIQLGEYGNQIVHQIDTRGGNSGASIINTETGEIVGIHTNGGCLPGTHFTNKGTAIHNNSRLKDAISRCLAK